MRELRYEIFLQSLIKKSKEQQIKWKCLDSNMELCRGIHLCRESLADKLYQNVPSFYFDTENSYYAEFPKENMFVALIVKSNSDGPATILQVIPNTFKNDLVLGFSDYGDLLTRLSNIIKSQFPNPDDFIASF